MNDPFCPLKLKTNLDTLQQSKWKKLLQLSQGWNSFTIYMQRAYNNPITLQNINQSTSCDHARHSQSKISKTILKDIATLILCT
jgi:hypothetical protein